MRYLTDIIRSRHRTKKPNGESSTCTPEKVDPPPIAPQEEASLTPTDKEETNLTDGSPRPNLWARAFSELDQVEQDILRPKDCAGSGSTLEMTDVISGVIKSTEEKYYEHQNEGAAQIKTSTGVVIQFRKVSRQILEAALDLKEIIAAGAACDPTGHAATAWTVVSFGLTVSILIIQKWE